KYMRAAWKRGGDPKFTPSGMNSAELARWTKFLDGKAKVPALDRWMRLSRTASEADVDTAAEDFQKQVVALIAESAEKPLNKQKNDLMLALFGDKGVHPLPDAELKKQMPSLAREALERDQDELKKLQKSPVVVPMAHGMIETGSGDMKVALRGDPTKPGE